MPQDYVQAHKWNNLAAATFTDKTFLEQAVTKRDLMAIKMTASQIAEAQKLAREWKPTNSARSSHFYVGFTGRANSSRHAVGSAVC